MACFIVPAAEAVIVTAAAAIMHSKEKKRREALKSAQGEAFDESAHEGFSKKLYWLAYLLWGGVILLAFEHLWHGEIVPWFPFLTAAESAESTAEMLHEMATVGVTMALLVTAVWGIIVGVSYLIEKRTAKAESVNE